MTERRTITTGGHGLNQDRSPMFKLWATGADLIPRVEMLTRGPLSSRELSTTKLEAVAREARRDGVRVFGTAPAELSGLAGWELARTRRK